MVAAVNRITLFTFLSYLVEACVSLLRNGEPLGRKENLHLLLCQ